MIRRFIFTALALLLAAPAMAATCSVSEFSVLVRDFSGYKLNIAKPLMPGPVTQTVTATTPTALTNPFSSGALFIWIYCDEVMHIQFDTTDATSGLTTNDMRIPAGGFWIGLPSEVSTGTLELALCDADCL